MIVAGRRVSSAQMPAGALAVRQFTDATRSYAWLHRRLENNLPPLDVTANPDTIHHAVQEMAAAIRVAAPRARQGDFFTDALAVELRLRIDDALAANGLTAADVHAAEAADGIDPALVRLTVNGSFPWIYATAMFPCVFHRRSCRRNCSIGMVGGTLVLIDVRQPDSRSVAARARGYGVLAMPGALVGGRRRCRDADLAGRRQVAATAFSGPGVSFAVIGDNGTGQTPQYDVARQMLSSTPRHRSNSS